MRQEKKELTEDEKFELALQQEAELGRLARAYTILDRNRNQFRGPAGKLAKQKRVLDIFRKEKKNITTDLTVASNDARKKEDEKNSRELSELLREYDNFSNDIKTQKAHLNEIDGQIKIVKKKVLDLSAKQLTDEQIHQRVIKSEKTLQTLENKLEVEVRKFCAICADNVKLREEINHLLIERTEFNKIWDKMINNLSIGKKFMLDLIEQATIAYDQREEWVSKLQFLRSKAHNDLMLHIQEMRVMQRKRDHDEKLQEYFAVKCQKRVMKALELKKQQDRQANREHLNRELERYLSIMVEIKQFTESETIGEIAKKFLDQEEENFGMFKYVTYLNKQMEDIADELAQLHDDIDEERELQVARREQQANRLEQLKETLEVATIELNEKQKELNNVDLKLKGIMNGIGTLFKMFKCKNDPLIQLLGHNETINYYNVLLYMNILEKNIQEILVNTYQRDKQQLDKKKIKLDAMVVPDIKTPPVIEPIENIVATNPCPLCVEHEQVSDVIDVLQLAYTKSQIQDILNRKRAMGKYQEKLHNVSACHLPKSRQIIQKRYQ